MSKKFTKAQKFCTLFSVLTGTTVAYRSKNNFIIVNSPYQYILPVSNDELIASFDAFKKALQKRKQTEVFTHGDFLIFGQLPSRFENLSGVIFWNKITKQHEILAFVDGTSQPLERFLK